MEAPPANRAGSTSKAINGENRLAKASTPMLLHYLRSYASGHSNQTEAVTRLLQCSARTANRMLNKRKPYRARIKTTWASLICGAVGKPLDNVLQARVSKTCYQALVGWTSARTFSEGMQLAGDCAQAISCLARDMHGLRGWHSVFFGPDGPTSLEVHLSPFPELARHGKNELHQLVISMRQGADGKKRMFIRLFDPVKGTQDDVLLTVKIVEDFINQIHALTKNLAADLARESAHLSATKSRRPHTGPNHPAKAG